MGFLFASHTRFIAVFLGICTLIFFVFPGFSQEITAQFDEHISQQGVASWYSETDPGILPTTANMEKFDDSQLTCALWDVPFNTLIKVKNLENGKYVVVRVNDRGPARRLVKNGRIIDLTRAAFARIASLDRGLIPVEITLLIQN
ncbi:MAG: septal ring lytic transglycosylase RlpA family protein [Candidatus Omnitrophica bacterium]|nr:septal ring lytic transglycosylase RlpA family protein [Candidatus Omnitrophota bacterium]